jgi:hypothetical protein
MADLISVDPCPADRFSAFGALLSCPGEPSVYSLLNDGTLKLGKNAEHLEECSSRRSGCVDHLLLEVQIATSGVEFT